MAAMASVLRVLLCLVTRPDWVGTQVALANAPCSTPMYLPGMALEAACSLPLLELAAVSAMRSPRLALQVGCHP